MTTGTLHFSKSATTAATAFPVSSFDEASRIYCERRDQSGEGGSTFSAARLVLKDGSRLHVSYNGRIWNGGPKDWVPGAKPVYDNREPAS